MTRTQVLHQACALGTVEKTFADGWTEAAVP
jgi:hypothetical protein